VVPEVSKKLSGTVNRGLAHDVHRLLNSNALREIEEQKAIINMLSHCANTDCHRPFLRLREGKLFLVETERLAKPGEPAVPPFVRAKQQARHVEHYWLCDTCAAQWTLVYDKDRGVALAPLRRPVTNMGAAAHSGVA
jgi:hypothetical protein